MSYQPHNKVTLFPVSAHLVLGLFVLCTVVITELQVIVMIL